MRIIVLVFILFSSIQSYAHEYFFAFAEVEYNSETQKIEATLTVSTHDLEHALKNANLTIGEIEDAKKGTPEFDIIEKYLLEHFKITSSKICHLKMIGYEVSLKGTTDFYFESEKTTIGDTITFSFDLLMQQYQKQQNKVTFYYQNKSYTRPFLYNQRVQIIKLNKS